MWVFQGLTKLEYPPRKNWSREILKDYKLQNWYRARPSRKALKRNKRINKTAKKKTMRQESKEEQANIRL